MLMQQNQHFHNNIMIIFIMSRFYFPKQEIDNPFSEDIRNLYEKKWSSLSIIKYQIYSNTFRVLMGIKLNCSSKVPLRWRKQTIYRFSCSHVRKHFSEMSIGKIISSKGNFIIDTCDLGICFHKTKMQKLQLFYDTFSILICS